MPKQVFLKTGTYFETDSLTELLLVQLCDLQCNYTLYAPI